VARARQSFGGLSCRLTVNRRRLMRGSVKDPITSGVASVLPSSVTTISKSWKVCWRTLSVARPTKRAWL
jgi:hypothetical protein